MATKRTTRKSPQRRSGEMMSGAEHRLAISARSASKTRTTTQSQSAGDREYDELSEWVLARMISSMFRLHAERRRR